MVAEHQTIHSALSLILNQMYFVNIEKAYTVSLGMPLERCTGSMRYKSCCYGPADPCKTLWFELPTGVTPAPDGCLTLPVNVDCTTESVHNFYGHNL